MKSFLKILSVLVIVIVSITTISTKESYYSLSDYETAMKGCQKLHAF